MLQLRVQQVMAAYPCQPHALARSELDWYGFSACAEVVHPLRATAYNLGMYPSPSSSLESGTDCLQREASEV